MIPIFFTDSARGDTAQCDVPERNSITRNSRPNERSTVQHDISCVTPDVNISTFKGRAGVHHSQSGDGNVFNVNRMDGDKTTQSSNFRDSHKKRLPNSACYAAELEHSTVGGDQFSQSDMHSNSHSDGPASIFSGTKSPKIVHYHLTIQNCDGLEIHVDNPEQKLKQKTVYSADGRKLKRLSWIEVPSNPIDFGPAINDPRSIDATAESDPVDGLPSNCEETVYISTEAESLFAGNEQVILQETPIVPHRRERMSYVNSTDVDSSLSPGMVSKMDNDTQAEETTSMHRHGSSQTDSPNQQSQPAIRKCASA